MTDRVDTFRGHVLTCDELGDYELDGQGLGWCECEDGDTASIAQTIFIVTDEEAEAHEVAEALEGEVVGQEDIEHPEIAGPFWIIAPSDEICEWAASAIVTHSLSQDRKP